MLKISYLIYAYIAAKRIGESCENWCDEAVLRVMGITDRKEYGRLLLSVMENSGRNAVSYSTSMAVSKKQIKKRLVRIVRYREATRTVKALGAVLVVAFSVCSLTAFGFSKAADFVPFSVSEVLEPNIEKPDSTQTPVYEDITEAPEQTYEPHITEQAVTAEMVGRNTEQPLEINETEAAEETAEPDYTSEPEKTYTFTVEPDTTDAPTDDDRIILERGSGYVLDVPESVLYSAVFTVSENMQIVINTAGDKITLIHNGKTAESKRFSISALQGDVYEIHTDMPNGGKIYIDCR